MLLQNWDLEKLCQTLFSRSTWKISKLSVKQLRQQWYNKKKSATRICLQFDQFQYKMATKQKAFCSMWVGFLYIHLTWQMQHFLPYGGRGEKLMWICHQGKQPFKVSQGHGYHKVRFHCFEHISTPGMILAADKHISRHTQFRRYRTAHPCTTYLDGCTIVLFLANCT